jgi:hypothetical protein
MHSDPATKPKFGRSALAGGLRAAVHLCWDCAFPPPEARHPAEFKPPPALDLQRLEQARHLSELSRNWPRWPL